MCVLSPCSPSCAGQTADSDSEGGAREHARVPFPDHFTEKKPRLSKNIRKKKKKELPFSFSQCLGLHQTKIESGNLKGRSR